jgi:DHA2 family multidrug resistance protein
MAGAAGLMSFIRTLSGAFATSIVNTVWEDSAAATQSELSGLLNGAQGTINGMVQGGMTHDQAVASLTQIVQGQATMIATDQIFVTSAFLFLIAAAVIWLAPKPTRAVAPGQAH